MLYNTLIHPHLLYCNIVWGNKTETALHRLIILPKRIIRVISLSGFQDHSSNLLSILILLNLMIFINFKLPSWCIKQRTVCHHEKSDLWNKLEFVSVHFCSIIHKRYIGIYGPLVWKLILQLNRSSYSISLFVRDLTHFLMSDY